MGKGSGTCSERVSLPLTAAEPTNAGIPTLAERRPQLVDYLVKKTYAQYEFTSTQSVKWKCPLCAHQWIDSIYRVYFNKNNPTCSNCSDRGGGVHAQLEDRLDVRIEQNLRAKNKQWACSEGHAWKRTAGAMKANEACPGCASRWSEDKLKARLLGVLMDNPRAQNWGQLFQEWGLYEIPRGNRAIIAARLIERHQLKKSHIRAYAEGRRGRLQDLVERENPRHHTATISIPDNTRGLIYQRDGYECQNPYCATPQSEPTIDHIVPVSKGGAWHDPSNLQTLCHSCNSSKNDRDWNEWLELKRLLAKV